MRVKAWVDTPTKISANAVPGRIVAKAEDPMALSASVQRERLAQLLKEDENSVCADCREPGPTWASTNHGTFICTQCAGVHR